MYNEPMVFFSRFRFLGRSPLTIVELIIAIASLIGGLYLVSPLLALSTLIHGASPLVTTLGSPIGVYLYGGALIAIGVFQIVAIFRRNYKWRSTGLFLNILSRAYGLFGTFIVQGPLPLTWLPAFVVILIAIVCYLVVRGMVINGVDSS